MQLSNIPGSVLVLAFTGLFLALIAAVYRRGIKPELERAARLPLED